MVLVMRLPCSVMGASISTYSIVLRGGFRSGALYAPMAQPNAQVAEPVPPRALCRGRHTVRPAIRWGLSAGSAQSRNESFRVSGEMDGQESLNCHKLCLPQSQFEQV